MKPEDIGRLNAEEEGTVIIHDAPSKQMEAVMSKIDELIAAINDGAAPEDAIELIKLRLG